MKLRRALKRPIELALSSRAAGRIARTRIRGKRLILAYHGIIPEGDRPAGERALFITQKAFAAQLDVLAAFADVASLDRIDEAGDGRPRIAITFDDAYRGAVCEGVEELVKRGLPATIFVAPGLLDRHVYWWDAICDGSAFLDEATRNHALHSLGGADAKVKMWAGDAGLAVSRTLPLYARTATRQELQAALAFPGITVGSHTWSHANLAALPFDEIATEIKRSSDWLRAEFLEKAVPWLAYPYGLDGTEVHRAAASVSCVGALRIAGGWHRASDVKALARPRLNIPASLSVEGFRARISGAFPA